jgi:hypothetical protein
LFLRRLYLIKKLFKKIIFELPDVRLVAKASAPDCYDQRKVALYYGDKIP